MSGVDQVIHERLLGGIGHLVSVETVVQCGPQRTKFAAASPQAPHDTLGVTVEPGPVAPLVQMRPRQEAHLV